MKLLLLLMLIIFSAACASQPAETGVLEGHVSIGPLDPVAQEGVPESTPSPIMYADRKIVIFNEAGQQEITQVDIEPTGNYQVSLPVGRYMVDINHLGIDLAKGFPQQVEIRRGQTTQLDVDIDTGIR
jgi:hypothetical protein